MKIGGIEDLFTRVCAKLVSFSVVVGWVLRIILLFNGQTEVSFSFIGWIEIFLLGAVNDVCVGIIACFFLWLNLAFWSESKYRRPWGEIILGLVAIAFVYVKFFNTIFNEYGGGASKIVSYFLGYKLLSFVIRLYVPAIRAYWRQVTFYLVLFLYVTAILLNAVSEFYFWNEFGVRYNFIAVDYLIYTTEVIGNIFESYPIVPLFSVLLTVAVVFTYFLGRTGRVNFVRLPSFKKKVKTSGIYFISVVIACGLLGFNSRFQNSGNVYVNELQANGTYRFYLAFVNNELSYDKFYVTLPEEEASEVLNAAYRSRGKNLQEIRDSLPEVHKNIVLITVESLSASFLERYGNKDGITPHIDRLMEEGLVFDNLYATGNRTVRGLEAVTLCLPPSPGQSIIKRPDNAGLFSTGKILKERGYIVQYLYGGNSYFDNMETFFTGNGYKIIDKKSFAPEEITFANIWGVCDEDMYRKALSVFDENAKSGRPFFGHIMTVSNHRPFTYPKGKIDIPENAKSRKGGIKYTDYALNSFLEAARRQPWFKETIFVITADHCASSAGKTEIPLDKYHIPALIYAPGYVQPQRIGKLVSQIDIMPTVFGLLHFSYDSYFYGKDVFSPDYEPRALIATYQNLGYWENDLFTILSPVKRVEQFQVEYRPIDDFNLVPVVRTDSLALKRAIANYQTVKR